MRSQAANRRGYQAPKREDSLQQEAYGPTTRASSLVEIFLTSQAYGPDMKSPSKDREKNPAAVALGRLGGLKGGKARAKALSKDDLVRIAKKAAKARWQKT